MITVISPKAGTLPGFGEDGVMLKEYSLQLWSSMLHIQENVDYTIAVCYVISVVSDSL